MQGEEAFEEMRRLDDSIPVIATSGRFEGDGSEAVISEHYAGVLAKPFSIDEMLAAVDTVLCY
jgi:DNA-binding response OmpR family regulator